MFKLGDIIRVVFGSGFKLIFLFLSFVLELLDFFFELAHFLLIVLFVGLRC